MPTMLFPENYYAFRHVNFGLGLEPPGELFALFEINSLMVQAGADYAGRRYQAAISGYQKAESLIFQHLDPAFAGGENVPFPHEPALFEPLLSASLEWLNKLAPSRPAVTVESRIPVEANLLGLAERFNNLGVGMAPASSVLGARHEETSVESVLLHPTAPEERATPSAIHSPIEIHPPIPFPRPIHPVAPIRSVGMIVSGHPYTISWAEATAPPINNVRQLIFIERVGITDLRHLIDPPRLPSDLALGLPHEYFFVIPAGLGDCYHQLGDYETAEQRYLQASTYKYLNGVIEAPFLWQRLARLYLDWGNSLFRQGNETNALPVYEKIVMPDASAPTSSPLYTNAELAAPAGAARQLIGALTRIVAGQVDATKLGVNPLIAAAVVEAYQQELKIKGGLDFWGLPTRSVPIWTFDYLQAVAANFGQLAISAERDVINFLDRADQNSLAHQQLVQAVSQSAAEVQAAQLQANATLATQTAYADAQTLANQRAQDARDNANEYQSQAWYANVYQALGAQVAGGDNGDWKQLNSLADQITAGSGLTGISRGTLAAAAQLAASRVNSQYEVDAMNRDASELATAAGQAGDEMVAARAATLAAQANVNVAMLHLSAAQQNLAAFDNQTFTAGVWHQMGEAMRRIYDRYFAMAIRAARLMQQAYNFETDQDLHLIKTSYAMDEVQGLLAADALMADIQTFTYELITDQKTKPQPVRQTISLATRYSFEFETAFRRTGEMNFETRISDFDAYYPGCYAGRIEAVEVEVDGIVPVSGVSGTLTNSGISSFRVPASMWQSLDANGLKYRVQAKETLVLSDYSAREDGFLYRQDSRKLGVFQGAGVASSWTLSLPKAVNDIDYGALTDVRITFYYKARFDPNLRARVLQQLATLPGINARQRAIPLRWIYPDAFFGFRRNGVLGLALKASDFRANETKPVLTEVGVLVSTDGTAPASGITVSLAVPGAATAVAATTDSGGGFASSAGNAWAPIATGSALGAYQIEISQAGNAALVKNGVLDLSPIINVTLLIAYSFTPKS